MQIQIIAFLLLFFSSVGCRESKSDLTSSTENMVFKTVSLPQSWQKTDESIADSIIYQSIDGGQTWQDVSAGLPPQLDARRFFAVGDEIFLGSEKGLFRSHTGFLTPNWEKDILLDETIISIYPGRSGPYAYSYSSGFYQEIPGTGTWKPMHAALKDKDIRAFLETADGSVFYGNNGGIYKSSDAGKTFQPVFKEGQVNALASSGEVLFAAGYKGMLRSTDGGMHWDWVMNEDGEALDVLAINGGVVIVSRGNSPWEQGYVKGRKNRMHISTDNGQTWQRLTESPAQAENIFDIQQMGGYLFCSHNTGILRSGDKGKTWEPVPSPKIEGFFRLTVSGKVMYALKSNGGC